MAITLAFDVYGTLIDTHSVTVALQEYVGEKAADFSRLWREKQLEYSFRRGLMQNYQQFSVCTSQALDYTCLSYKISLSDQDKQKLMEGYRVLPAFPDVKEGLEHVKTEGFRMFAFSNGSADAVEMLLQNAGIRAYFDGVVSVDALKIFKPSPAVYCHFLRSAHSTGAESWMISGNPFDVIGSISAGMRAAWIQRSPETIFDPWEIQPTLILNSLSPLAVQIKNAST
ncbi:MAG: haloacid dehalogenase type II [SAR324 cluster bacterium]|nr:haloacid dehalogenase type II [SAR324 cluster bacterium]